MKFLYSWSIIYLLLFWQVGNAQSEQKTQIKPIVHYFIIFNVLDSAVQVYYPITDLTMDYPYSNKTVLILLDGTILQASKSKIETFGCYKFTTFSESNSSIPDTLEQAFIMDGYPFSSELKIEIINTSSDSSSMKKLNKIEYEVPIFEDYNYFPEYKMLTKEWFINNIGAYLQFGYRKDFYGKKIAFSYRKLSNTVIENFIGTVSTINGKEFNVFGKSIYV